MSSAKDSSEADLPWWQTSGLSPAVQEIADATIAKVLPWMVIATGIAALIGATIHILFLEPGFRPWLVPAHLLYVGMGVYWWRYPPRRLNVATAAACFYLTTVITLYLLAGEFSSNIHFGILLVGSMFISLDRRLLAALFVMWILALTTIAIRWMPSDDGITMLVLSLISAAGGLTLRRMRLANVEEVAALKQQLDATIIEREVAVERAHNAEKMESLGVMAAGVAHDYNNLLVGVIGGVDLAAQARNEAERELALETIRASASSLTSLSAQLLEVSGGRPISKQQVDLNEVVERTLAAVASDQAIARRVNCELAETLPLIEGEPASLQQVVLNLVTNALSFASEQDGAVLVRTTASNGGLERQATVTLSVQDDGPGVPQEYRNRIFDPFFTTSDTGRGLGLATAKTITLRHEGDLTLHPTPVGVRFDATFPAIASDSALPAQALVASDLPTLQSNLLVLLVDDDESVRAITARMLNRLGHRVVEAESGDQALALLTSTNPDLAVVDAIMPGMDGAQTIQAMRLQQPHLGIVLYSGYHYAAEDNEKLPANVQFLPKPFNTTDLAAVLARVNTQQKVGV